MKKKKMAMMKNILLLTFSFKPFCRFGFNESRDVKINGNIFSVHSAKPLERGKPKLILNVSVITLNKRKGCQFLLEKGFHFKD